MKHEDDIRVRCASLDPRFGVDETIAERLQKFADHLRTWQKAINLISGKTLPQLWDRHILDSLQIVPHVPDSTRVIVDLGSGAGFPGLILGLFDRWEVHLVESDTRKAAFLRDSARVCGVAVKVEARRIEAVEPFPADLVTARALAPLTDLLAMSARFRHSGTSHLFLKGRGAEAELTDAAKNWTLRVESIPSMTDPLASILKIDEVRRNGSGTDGNV